jgi:hypothetical protein
MDPQLIIDNLLQPSILFFMLGMGAVLVRSDLEIPPTLSKLFSLYLLLSIGFKGGVKLAESGIDFASIKAVFAGLVLSAVVPLYTFQWYRRRMDSATAAAIAATYGSVSAITFLTASSMLSRLAIDSGGYMVAVMALMESPAIIVGVMLARKFAAASTNETIRKRVLARESLTNSSVFLLLGSMLIGMLSGTRGWEAMEPFAGNLFQGMLCFFLLDMGMIAARRFGDLRGRGVALVVSALVLSVFNGLVSIGFAKLLHMGVGDTVLLAILGGSASYIAVPAAMRHAVPEANPGVYVAMALAITFPLNIILGIPFYTWLASSI